MNHLCIDLCNDTSLTATLICHYDDGMSKIVRWELTADKLKKNADDVVDWLPFDLKHTQGISRLVYYPCRGGSYMANFTDEIERLRKSELKSIIRIPQHLAKSPFRNFAWDFKSMTFAIHTDNEISSEMTVDLRDK